MIVHPSSLSVDESRPRKPLKILHKHLAVSHKRLSQWSPLRRSPLFATLEPEMSQEDAVPREEPAGTPPPPPYIGDEAEIDRKRREAEEDERRQKLIEAAQGNTRLAWFIGSIMAILAIAYTAMAHK